MFKVLVILVIGFILGRQIRSEKAPTTLSRLLNIIIYVLLTVMGICVGGNKDIINNLSTIGLQSLIITIGAMAGSILFAFIIYRYIFKKREEQQ